MKHHFTVDVEEYFHPTSVERWYPREGWDGLERRSTTVVPRLLELLSERGVAATFFVLGWLAQREPDLVRRICAEGHEIASHGWSHRVVHCLRPEEFRRSVRRSKRILEDICGCRVVGYRAPSFSIVPGAEWALEILGEEGYEYDSSLFPTSLHPSYGYPEARRDPYRLDGSPTGLIEVPPATMRIGGVNLPAAGGAYFRLLPYSLLRWSLRQAEGRGQPGTFYIHPWELDEEPPEIPAPWLVRFRLRGGRRRVWARIERLLDEFSFTRMAETVRGLQETDAGGHGRSGDPVPEDAQGREPS